MALSSTERSRRWRRRNGVPERTRPPCGTRNGYKSHKDHGETPCPECVEANREYMREAKRRQRARERH